MRAAGAVVEAASLGRFYGQVVGLSDLDVEVGPGVTGLVGPNGAGKSTLLALAAGELRPTRGRIRVLGLAPFASRRFHRRLGYAPQRDALYDDMTGRAMVAFLLRLHGFGRREASARADRALERVGLADGADRPIGGYSKGMRQRVKIAQAIAHGPELLVLDEPLAGLDPVGRRDVQALLREIGAEGTSILVSSHVLHEVEDLTSEVVLLHRGRLLAQGPVPEIRRLLTRHPRRVEIEAREPRRLARALLADPAVLSARVDEERGLLAVEVRGEDGFDRRLTALLAGEKAGVRSFSSVDAGLEAVFDYLVG